MDRQTDPTYQHYGVFMWIATTRTHTHRQVNENLSNVIAVCVANLNCLRTQYQMPDVIKKNYTTTTHNNIALNWILLSEVHKNNIKMGMEYINKFWAGKQCI